MKKQKKENKPKKIIRIERSIEKAKKNSETRVEIPARFALDYVVAYFAEKYRFETHDEKVFICFDEPLTNSEENLNKIIELGKLKAREFNIEKAKQKEYRKQQREERERQQEEERERAAECLKKKEKKKQEKEYIEAYLRLNHNKEIKIKLNIITIALCIAIIAIFGNGLRDYLLSILATLIIYNLLKIVLVVTDAIFSIIAFIGMGKSIIISYYVISLLLLVGSAYIIQFTLGLTPARDVIMLMICVIAYYFTFIVGGKSTSPKTNRDYLREINAKLDRL